MLYHIIHIEQRGDYEGLSGRSHTRNVGIVGKIVTRNMGDIMKDIVVLLEEKGPLTGKEILEHTREDEFQVWKYCVSFPDIVTRIIGRRYLRLDRQVEGYARLSPSIMREFFGYTIIGLKNQNEEIDRRAELLQKQIRDISKRKFQLAQELVTKLVESQKLTDLVNEKACVIIAGDVAYGMSHMEPRPEFSTGEMVRGSDLDIVIITESMDSKTIGLLDSMLYQEKYMLLRNPSYKEEIDYLIKDVTKMENQLLFDNFENMIACKILDEGEYLYGNKDLFLRLKAKLKEYGIPDKLWLLEQKAIDHRKDAESMLIHNPGVLSNNEITQLFYTTAEREEFF